MARGIMRNLKLEGSIIDALNRLTQQERTVLEEQERATEYYEAAREALDTARRRKERADVQADKNLSSIMVRRKSLEVATNAGEVVDIEGLLIPLELEYADSAEDDGETWALQESTHVKSRKREQRDTRVIRNRKGIGRSEPAKKENRVAQTSRMFAWNELPTLKTRQKARSASLQSVKTKSSQSAKEQNDFGDWVSVEKVSQEGGYASRRSSPGSKGRSASLLSEIAVYRPGTPTQPEESGEREHPRSAEPGPAVNAASELGEDGGWPALLEKQPDGDGLEDERVKSSAQKRSRSGVGEQVPVTAIIDEASLQPSRESSLGSTWATSEGTGLFVSEKRRPRVILEEGTLVAAGNVNSLPTPQSQSPKPGLVRPQKPKRSRKRDRQDRGRDQSSSPPPPPPPQAKKRRKVEQNKASSRKRAKSAVKQRKEQVQRVLGPSVHAAVD